MAVLEALDQVRYHLRRLARHALQVIDLRVFLRQPERHDARRFEEGLRILA